MTVFRFNKETKKIEKKLDEQPAYVSFIPSNPWNRNGQHRQASPKAHRDPSNGAGAGARTDEDDTNAYLTGISQQITSTFAYSAPRRSGKSVSLVDLCEMIKGAYKPKPPTIPYAGIRSGEIIGHRAWWVLPEGLCSIAHLHIWQPNATIEGKLDEVVWQNIYTREVLWGGVYTYATADLVFNECKQLIPALQMPGPKSSDTQHPINHAIGLVRGTAKLWGEVIEHEIGWRAQFAKLASIDFICAERYNVNRVIQVLRPYHQSLGNDYDLAPYPV